MRILTICGTRPELVRLSRIIPKLDKLCEHTFVHTGQNYDPKLRDIFFKELEVRPPDISWGMALNTVGQQVGYVLQKAEETLAQVSPDRVLILGDTNSALSSYMARRMGIPVYHMEAGNRCHDLRSPEEANRVAIDHWSTVLMPYTERSRGNLLREGIAAQDIYVIGNPIFEVLYRVPFTKVLKQEGLEPGGYFLVTLHRQENVDDEERLVKFVLGLCGLNKEYAIPVVLSCHPRTKKRMQEARLDNMGQLRVYEPFGFKDFVTLEKNARCVLSDSGTVQEECCILHTPTVTLRDTTERPETIECGSNILSGCEPESILDAVKVAQASPRNWRVPAEYLVEDVSDTVCKILLGYR